MSQKRLKKVYNVSGLYYANRDAVEFYFRFEHTHVCLCYSGETIRESTYKDMLRRVEDDLKNYEGEEVLNGEENYTY